MFGKMEESWLPEVELKIIFFILYIVGVGSTVFENCTTGFKSYIIIGPFIFLNLSAILEIL